MKPITYATAQILRVLPRDEDHSRDEASRRPRGDRVGKAVVGAY